MFCLIRSCFFCQRATERSNCLFSLSTASNASLSGGGITKHTPGTELSTLDELETRHFTRPELSCKMHCSPFSITIYPRKEQKVSYYNCSSCHPFGICTLWRFKVWMFQRNVVTSKCITLYLITTQYLTPNDNQHLTISALQKTTTFKIINKIQNHIVNKKYKLVNIFI